MDWWFQTIAAAVLMMLPAARTSALPDDAPRVTAEHASGVPTVMLAKTGRLVYQADGHGNQIVDFSHAGYQGGGAAIPDAPVRVVVSAGQGDNGPRIQAAIDYVARLPADARGLRGAVLLLKGRHEIADQLRIEAGGVVLRGQGQGADGTVLVATGTDRRTLIQLAGKADRQIVSSAALDVGDRYVPVGARQLRLKRPGGLNVGDSVLIHYPSTAAWIRALGMDRFPSQDGTGSWLNWRPGTMDLRWDRKITKIEGDTITLDAPLTSALDASLSQAHVQVYRWPERLRQVGVENLSCESAHASGNPRDEEHAWMAITMDAVQDAWVREVTMCHFAGGAVSLWDGCKQITVEDCRVSEPISEIGGYRRHTFYTSGQLTLFQRCRSAEGIHDFAVGYLAAGPNVFLGCEAERAHGFSGPIESWATGVLYDNVVVDGGALALTNHEIDAHGVGWAAANCVLWQCAAPIITCRRPPTGYNGAIGAWGQIVGDGFWKSLNQSVKPASLYRAQLEERHGAAAVMNLQRRTIPASGGDAPAVDAIAQVEAVSVKTAKPAKPLALRNGWLVCDGKLVLGGRTGTTWWRGQILPSVADSFGKGVTRFVPGRIGPGYTDDLDRLTDAMRLSNQVMLEHHWGLWYDRRRDDHEMVRRIDGNVWPPFYEQPWARSGQGTAWDGLSKYDLTHFNPWYFRRLKQFADLCDQKGLVLLHQMYFQHNILEAGAHWADFPWRPANCLQDTGFPEPPPYVNNKRIFMADAFYDVGHGVRRQLHRAYIRKCLETFANNTNVIFVTGAEFTGPLEFVRFWLDTIREWQAETGNKTLVGLSCTKDVQDAILLDPVRGRQVSVIDLRYWWYAADGALYAPQGGQSLAPRQHLREWKGNKSRSVEQTARQVREYRERYPDKAILSSLDRAEGWSVLAAGGSIPHIAATTDTRLREAVPRMKPWKLNAAMPAGQWGLADPDHDYLVCAHGDGKIRLDLSATQQTYAVRWVDLHTGEVTPASETVQGGQLVELANRSAAGVLWLTRK